MRRRRDRDAERSTAMHSPAMLRVVREPAERADRHQQVHDEQREPAERRAPDEQSRSSAGSPGRAKKSPTHSLATINTRLDDHQQHDRADRRAVASADRRRAAPADGGRAPSRTPRASRRPPRRRRPRGCRGTRRPPGASRSDSDPNRRSGAPSANSGAGRRGAEDRVEVEAEPGHLDVARDQVEDRRPRSTDVSTARGMCRFGSVGLLREVRGGLEPDEDQHAVEHAEQDAATTRRARSSG